MYQYTASVQRDLGANLTATVAYVGSQGRNQFLRSVSNRTIGVLQTNLTAAATNVREFDVVTCSDGRVLDGRVSPIASSVCGAGATAVSKQSPFAEVDYKTSGGHNNYNSLQTSLTRRSANGVTMNAQYTLGYSKGNTGGSNEAVTAGNNARAISEFDYDDGYNNFDVRHTLNLSLLYDLPGSGPFLSGWSVAGIVNARSGIPVPVLVQRNDIVLRRRRGQRVQQRGGRSHGPCSTRREAARRATPAAPIACRAWTSTPSRMACCSSTRRRSRRRRRGRSVTSNATPSTDRGCGRPI